MSARARLMAVLSLILLAAAPGAAQPAVDREIVHVKGGLYRVRVADQHTLFLVTPAGIALVDPLSVDTAQWLQEEFARRFKPAAVKYVVHTNHRFDRAEGASLFVAPADIVGHREFNSELSNTRRGRAASIPVSDRVRARDRNGDGVVTAEEIYSRVRDVESYFDDRRALGLGGRTIEMVHARTALRPENSIVNFPAERIAFASEAPPLDNSPFTFDEWKAADLKRWLAAAAAIDFDTLLLADGRSIPKARITRLHAYVTDLMAKVIEEYEGGASPADFTESKVPQAYRSDAMFREWRGNVADIYRDLSIFRVEAAIGGLGHYTVRDTASCGAFTTCSTGGLVPGAIGSLSVGPGRWAGVAELSVADDSFTSRSSRFLDEDFALVETRTALMVRYSRPNGAGSIRFLGGVSYTVGDRRGYNRVKEGLAPFAGRHPIASRHTRWGYTGGVDLVIGHRVGIVVPLRFNFAAQDPSGTFPHRLDAQAGLALTFRLLRSVD